MSSVSDADRGHLVGRYLTARADLARSLDLAYARACDVALAHRALERLQAQLEEMGLPLRSLADDRDPLIDLALTRVGTQSF